MVIQEFEQEIALFFLISDDESRDWMTLTLGEEEGVDCTNIEGSRKAPFPQSPDESGPMDER